jgi:hypothetical protein
MPLPTSPVLSLLISRLRESALGKATAASLVTRNERKMAEAVRE